MRGSGSRFTVGYLFEKPTHVSDRPDRNQFNTALVKDDLHSLTRLQIKGFPDGLRDNYVKFW